ncbi:cytotoxic translational repressor of toxin-antitoxin stability system [Halodesulfurarchaeum formicicum]|uniref:Cytotoxic translational repressor of toxin-antitoxin stability system n=1 Tax=Halodesulfurarchaeum formicicum TaxID=1873524 RepID=A0A1J1ADV7_9EURY|nr:cytotoxic translational repressor of toxin-antitoxin stability system [Halodesulfurarchaeum formicicum]
MIYWRGSKKMRRSDWSRNSTRRKIGPPIASRNSLGIRTINSERATIGRLSRGIRLTTSSLSRRSAIDGISTTVTSLPHV